MSENFSTPATFPVLRKFSICALTGVAALVGILVVLPYVLPTSIIRGLAEDAISTALERPVRIAGAVRMTLFPSLSINAKALTTGAPEDNDSPVLLDMAGLVFEIKLLPLLFNEIHLGRVSIQEPVLRLQVDVLGQSNWASDGRSAASKRASLSSAAPDYEWDWWQDLRFGGLEIVNGRVIYSSRRTGRNLMAERINLASSVTEAGDGPAGVRISGSASLNGETLSIGFDTGSAARFISGARTPFLLNVTGPLLKLRFQGGLARRQFFLMNGNLMAEAGDVGEIRQWLGLKARPEDQGPLRIAAKIEKASHAVSIRDLEFRHGATSGRGMLTFGTLKRPFAVEGTLEMDSLDLTTIVSGFAAHGRWADTGIFLPLQGTVRAQWGALRAGGLSAGAGAAEVSFGTARERFSLRVENLQLYGGRGAGQVRLSVGEGLTSLDAKLELSGIEVAELLKAFGRRPTIIGRGSGNLGLFSIGGTPRQLVAALKGQGRFNIENGVLLDRNLAAHLRSARASRMEFEQLLGSFVMRRGILEGQDLLLRAPNYSLVGEGSIDLAEDLISVRLHSVAADGPSGPSTKRRIKPFQIEGSLGGFIIQPE